MSDHETHWSPAVNALIERARAEALREAADEFADTFGPVWGGDASWLTSGTKVANLIADVLREMAEESTP